MINKINNINFLEIFFYTFWGIIIACWAILIVIQIVDIEHYTTAGFVLLLITLTSLLIKFIIWLIKILIIRND